MKINEKSINVYENQKKINEKSMKIDEKSIKKHENQRKNYDKINENQ